MKQKETKQHNDGEAKQATVVRVHNNQTEKGGQGASKQANAEKEGVSDKIDKGHE